ncbi:hypothetical protein OG384_14850 [Streptomyces sp. NBC_01324]|uniref:hypothetical protein n=1 Tax=Streptomyces sp. NBC_01324 TaxID=2903826 RepID=UPI002E10C630|nr:hypothetical protein OG384_14850 [Streptomyces sp. NBC_01324]
MLVSLLVWRVLVEAGARVEPGARSGESGGDEAAIPRDSHGALAAVIPGQVRHV